MLRIRNTLISSLAILSLSWAAPLADDTSHSIGKLTGVPVSTNTQAGHSRPETKDTTPCPGQSVHADVTTSEEKDYIVVFRQNATRQAVDSHMTWFADIVNQSISQQSGGNKGKSLARRSFRVGRFQAYSARLDASSAAKVMEAEDVDFVEEDQIWSVQGIVEQANATWGLDYISRLNASTQSTNYSYTYDNSSGSGTYAYIVDSGVEIEHEEFEGRAVAAYNAVEGSNDTDTAGHGTHVAGIIGGKTFGVAKKSQIMSVKVFGPDGSGSSSDVLGGFQWAVEDIVKKNRTEVSVINMSLGGGYSAAFNLAVKQAYDAGVLSVVAAGNDGADVNDSSPASEPSAITVGAMQQDMTRSDYSNYGEAVDLFAPGTEILSSFSSSPNATALLSGTSMAAPFVSGLVLYLKAVEGPSSPANSTQRVIELARKDLLDNIPDGTVNLLAFNGMSLGDEQTNTTTLDVGSAGDSQRRCRFGRRFGRHFRQSIDCQHRLPLERPSYGQGRISSAEPKLKSSFAAINQRS